MTRSALVLWLVLLGAAGPAAAQPAGSAALPLEWRGRIGLQVQPMTPELREHLKAPPEVGVLVVRVEPDSAAAEAGVRVGDIVTRAGGEAVATPHDLIQRVGRVPEGERLALELVRDGEAVKLEVAPRGAAFPGDVEGWMRGGMRHGIDALERRLEELERRLEQLENRLPAPKPT